MFINYKGGEKIRKQVILLVITFVFALTLCGAVFAEDNITPEVMQSDTPLGDLPESDDVLPEIKISGIVLDCETGEPFSNVTVKAEGNGEVLATTTTAADGKYELIFQSLLTEFTVTASHQGHKPSSTIVSPNSSESDDSNIYGTADFKLGKPKALFLFHTSIDPIFGTAVVDCDFLESDMRLIRNLPVTFTDYDLVFVDWLSGTSPNLAQIRTLMEEAIKKGIPVIVTITWTELPEGVIVANGHTNHQYIRNYWTNRASTINSRELLKYLGVEFLGLNLGELNPPVSVIKTGIYHPDTMQLFNSLEDYINWYGSIGGQKTVGILFHETDYLKGDLEAVDALIRAFENEGIKVIPYFYEHEGKPNIERFLMKDGKSAVDVIVHYKMFGWSPGCSTEDVVVSLEKLNVPVIKAQKFFGTYGEWYNGTMGLQQSAIAATVVPSERDGMFGSIVISTREQDSKYLLLPFEVTFFKPIDRQVNWVVELAISWINLRYTPNSEKKVAILYWHSPGKAEGAGAGHLDVYASLINILEALKKEGYYVGDSPLPTETDLVNLIRNQGLSIGLWAPGELENLVKNNPVIKIPLDDYMEWFNELNEAKRKEVIDMWGEPPGNIMVYENMIILPVIQFGNIILAPEPARGYTQDHGALYHSGDIPPTHQYLAFYFWLKQGFDADAAINLGRHGTVAWLPGKTGPGLDRENCWPAIVSQDIPVIYPFTVEGGESLLPIRRQVALMISHLIPPVTIAGLYGDLAVLHMKMHEYDSTYDESVKEEYRKTLIEIIRELRLHEDLNIDLDAINDFEAFMDDIHEYLHELENAFINNGLHVFGIAPEGDRLLYLVQSLLGYNFQEYLDKEFIGDHHLVDDHEMIQEKVKQLLQMVIFENKTPEEAQLAVLGSSTSKLSEYLSLAIKYSEYINQSNQEIKSLLKALSGQYITSGPSGDPVINPEVLPTGKNLYSFDPRIMPTQEAWNVAVKLVDDLIDRYMQETGEYPKKIAFVLWATHTQQDRGVMEAAILYLLGVEPVPDPGFKFHYTDVKLIEDLNRPRIDVVITTTALYLNMFRCRLELLDKAIRLAAGSKDDKHPNYVWENSEKIYQALIENGLSEEESKKLSMSRIFSQASGNHHNAMQHALLMSDTWGDEGKLAETYIGTFGHVFNGLEKDPIFLPDLYTLALDGSEIALFRRVTNVNDLLGDDDYYGYFGGLGLTIRSITGNDPLMWIMNVENPANPRIESLTESLWKDLRTSYFNPRWIKAMQEHNSAGARELTHFLKHMVGWTITSPNSVTKNMWDEAYSVYVMDKHNLGLKDWFNQSNPYALESMYAQFMETSRKGYWQTDVATKTHLANEWANSIIQNGVSCSPPTCSNLDMVEWAMQYMDANLASQFKEQMFKATENVMFAPGGIDPGVTPGTPGTTPGTPGETPAGGSNQGSSSGHSHEVSAEAAQESAESAEAGEEGAKSYEVSTADSPSSSQDNSLIYTLIGIISILALVGAGFYFGPGRRG
ncbi:cobaltochelatase subunit CobN [Methanobacterium alkalithermotolerans]|uniref:Cobaltochelatase subunit CobN n=1 Tax=Methanobacterium alkalithermotolerans TaxID=2731220 RepID=A0A8T8K9B7_9EURY|nr:cobaltochelatase subunit CobN [Methanobacterium alkalithermotolerans]QUH23440.1 cobaltochelatase subunit CobN [Methanobacterium alkalithermotolerans]